MLPTNNIQYIVQGNSFLPQMKLGNETIYQDRHTKHRKSIYLDVARKEYSLNALKKVIDILSRNKQAELFLHFSDNEAFRIKLDYFPQHEGFYYTKDEIVELCAYANAKHIMIIPVFDVPAHSKGWLELLKTNYPEKYDIVVSDFDDSLCDYWDNGEPIEIIKNILNELYPIFKQPRFEGRQLFHLGMDEVSAASGNQSWLFWYMEYLINHTIENGYTPVLWNDVVLTQFLTMVEEVGLDSQLVYTYWQQALENSVTPDEIMSYSPVYNGNFWTQTFHAHNLSGDNSVPYMTSTGKRNGFKTNSAIVDEASSDNLRGGMITIWGHDAETRDENDIVEELDKIFTAFTKSENL